MIKAIIETIKNDPMNKEYTAQGVNPLFKYSKDALILLIGQAPGAKTVATGELFRDQSGERLRSWLGVDTATFYGPKFAVLPMDFYFPGKGKTGDLPPRKEFAAKYHPALIALMPNVKLIIYLGRYAINYYLHEKSTTSAVRNFKTYLPKAFPLIHPSPLNARWISKNPWFNDVLVDLKSIVSNVLSKHH